MQNDTKEFPIVIFADGACSGNPGPGGFGTVVATPAGEVTELGGGSDPTTNNKMELMAAIAGLEYLRTTAGLVWLYTDSTYVIRGITQWIFAWRTRGWKTAEGADVTNRDLWERLFAAVMSRKSLGKIEWKYVRGHTGVAGNERVDEIAVAFAKKQHPRLYRGPLLQYGIPIHDVPEDKGLPEMKPKPEKKAAAHSYLSLIDGVVKRHKTWGECESRVKGKSGARFKKAMSAEDEAQILSSWGVRL